MNYTTRFDLRFAPEGNPSEATLFLQVGQEGLQLLITDAGHRPLAFRAVEFEKEAAENGSLVGLRDWLLEHRDWTRQWSKLWILHDCPQVSIVPAALYNVDNGKELLDAQFGDLFKGTLLTEQVSGRQDYAIYRIPTEAYHALSNAHPNSLHRHLLSVWLAWLEKLPTAAAGQIFLLFDNNRVAVAIRKEDWLLVQSYAFQQPEDISYYLLAATTHLNLDPETVELFFNGWIDTGSSLYAELFKYFRNIAVTPAPEGVTLSAESLQDQPEHYFTPLMQLASCVS